ncbi:MAG: hypothetical protein ACK5CA_16130 [Cyanobacteriota bacterium]|jgi:hypothetical protein
MAPQRFALPLLLLAPFLFPQTLQAQDAKTIGGAAKVYCQALKQGQSPAQAQDASREYIMNNLPKGTFPNPLQIRQQVRAEVLKQCPQQAQKPD